MIFKYELLAFTVTLAACSGEKTENAAAKDSTVTVPVRAAAPTPAAVLPAPASTVEPSKPAPKAVTTPAAGGERDSAVQAVFEIGPGGKLRRVKR